MGLHIDLESEYFVVTPHFCITLLGSIFSLLVKSRNMNLEDSTKIFEPSALTNDLSVALASHFTLFSSKAHAINPCTIL